MGVMSSDAGWIVVLNGTPRSGKSGIAQALATLAPGRWVNLGVDAMALVTPPSLRPGIGLRPGGERPELEDHVVNLFSALFESVAAFSRLGFHVAVDVGIHDGYSTSRGVWHDAAARWSGLPVLVVGVRCPTPELLVRFAASPTGIYVEVSEVGPVPPAITRWQEAVHRPGLYDLEVDTSSSTPEECAGAISRALEGPAPTALGRLGAQA
jgi:chloramphenicol 3-O phosphotransferase